uniref:Uncharacterized protein n=1 Tax=Panagrolaimus sp. ES5 TaxID=591445 RepID=A0AC34G1Q5_9BILA
MQQLIKCTAEKLIDSCVTIDNFRTISGLSDGSTKEYVNDYFQMQYRCSGNGFKEFKDTYTCMKQMQDCPGDPTTCTDFIPYLKCIEDMAYKFCGAEGRDYICNSMDIVAQVYLCPLPVCSKNQTEVLPFKKLFKFKHL